MPSLAHLRVIDVTQVMAGPFAAMLLADLGADVVKIEPPAGDSTRQMPGAIDGDTPAFNAVNRGKRSVVVDLKHARGRDVFRRLAQTADILIENYRPGVMAGLGLGYDALSAANPRLVYASISGYGQTGPARGKGGFDLIAQGVSGIMSITGDPDGPPVKCGVPLTDLGAGLFAVGRAPGSSSTRRSSTPASRFRCGRRRSTSAAPACRSRWGRRTA
jgi:crotonobetainyl-CoA:carnitine CoA-transferase CaiB-like acyl-CoA transferase